MLVLTSALRRSIGTQSFSVCFLLLIQLCILRTSVLFICALRFSLQMATGNSGDDLSVTSSDNSSSHCPRGPLLVQQSSLEELATTSSDLWTAIPTEDDSADEATTCEEYSVTSSLPSSYRSVEDINWDTASNLESAARSLSDVSLENWEVEDLAPSGGHSAENFQVQQDPRNQQSAPKMDGLSLIHCPYLWPSWKKKSRPYSILYGQTNQGHISRPSRPVHRLSKDVKFPFGSDTPIPEFLDIEHVFSVRFSWANQGIL
ncbi:uncharacterized protein LOC130274537 [Hyla sarda]|uniref:uncharacterized protein LOC130274537 n=1 Tax=Hyla sarda TaxID=327740 RepID=UPI0024C3C4E8|nr:uncharacterized protein LOC130274537 [Hyla sarda]